MDINRKDNLFNLKIRNYGFHEYHCIISQCTAKKIVGFLSERRLNSSVLEVQRNALA